MAGKWRTSSLGELCEFRAGSVFKPALQGKASGEYPFVKVSDMNLPANAVCIQDAKNWVSREDVAELRARAFPAGTVVFAKIGEALRQNRLRQVARETIIDNNMMGAIPRAHCIDARYFYYALSQFDFAEIAQGTALPYLTVSSLSALTLDFPPAEEQRAIAHILGTLDDKIELNRRVSETLEAMARALFKSWFVDFDPVRAKAEGRDPGIPEPLADLFPSRLVDSELGEIPEGWEVRLLGDLLEFAYGKALKAEDRRDGSIPVYGSNGQVGWHNERLAAGPGIAVGRKGNPGVVTWTATDFFVIDTAFYVVPKVPGRNLHYLFHALRSHDLASLSADSAVPGLNRNLAYMSMQLWPGQRVLERFDKIARALAERVHWLEQESRTLAALRDALLPKLISGALRVKDAERIAARAV